MIDTVENEVVKKIEETKYMIEASLSLEFFGDANRHKGCLEAYEHILSLMRHEKESETTNDNH